jgi:DNA polymerase-4
VAENLKGLGSATEIAQQVRARIRTETGLTASAGVSYNKFLAKLASDHRKPDGLFVITPRMGAAFVERLPVRKFHGVGPATAAKMNNLGIKTGADLRSHPLAFMQEHFGKTGSYYYSVARGIDDTPVRADRIRKSVGAENTFDVDLYTSEAARHALQPIVEKTWRHCESAGTLGRTVTLKVKYADFHQVTRSRTEAAPVATRAQLERQSRELLERLFPVVKGVRLLGVTLSTLDDERTKNMPQLSLAL